MKTIVCEKYGPPEVLKIIEAEKPIPNANEVLVKIIATTVNAGDVRIRSLNVPWFARIIMRLMYGLLRPRKPLGTALSGVVESIGNDAKLFKPGDEVYAHMGLRLGAYVEYIAIDENRAVALKPTQASFEEAASIPFGGVTAIYFLDKAGIGSRTGQNVLVYGASGAVGTAAVQIAKHYGARVTAVCGEDGVELTKSLGADYVIVYTKEDFTNSDQKYDIIFDTVGKIPKKRCAGSLAQNGKYITTAGTDTAKENKEQLVFLREMFDKGEYKAVIDRIYPLESIVEAHRYVDEGKKKGSVVIQVQN